MPHPISVCATAASLYNIWVESCRLHNDTPVVLRGPAIDSERLEKAYIETRMAYVMHMQQCEVCRQALKEMDET